MKNKITIYTDGAAKGNPGKAGWGAIVMTGDKVHEMGGYNNYATNNQMELTASIEALKYIKLKCGRQGLPQVEIFSDSKYVILGITEWIHNWVKNGWKNITKKPVLNKEFWEDLYALNTKFKPKWNYVKGHNGDKWNERADVIATSFADGEPII